MRVWTTIILLVVAFGASGQSNHFTDTAIKGKCFHYVEQMPEPGYDFDKKFREYLLAVADRPVPDTIVVDFTVNIDGALSRFKVFKGIGATVEIVTALRMMPKWKPGRQNGKIVPVEMVRRIKMRQE